jgi:hypothetical protein
MASQNPVGPATAEFNGDGITDLAVVTSLGVVGVRRGAAPGGTTPSSLTLSSSSNPSTYGQSVSLTATASPPLASGTVTFYEGTSVLGIARIASGSAIFQNRLPRRWSSFDQSVLRRRWHVCGGKFGRVFAYHHRLQSERVRRSEGICGRPPSHFRCYRSGLNTGFAYASFLAGLSDSLRVANDGYPAGKPFSRVLYPGQLESHA